MDPISHPKDIVSFIYYHTFFSHPSHCFYNTSDKNWSKLVLLVNLWEIVLTNRDKNDTIVEKWCNVFDGSKVALIFCENATVGNLCFVSYHYIQKRKKSAPT